MGFGDDVFESDSENITKLRYKIQQRLHAKQKEKKVNPDVLWYIKNERVSGDPQIMWKHVMRA